MTHYRSLCAIAAVALPVLLQPAALPAQSGAPWVETGERVRVDYVVTGTLLDHDDEVLVIQPDGESFDRQELALAQVDRVEAWRCCDRGKGFLVGALVGTGAALLGGAILQSLPSEPGTGANMAMAGAVLVGIPLGIGVGGAMGATVLAPRGWVRVEIPRP